jgi:hypothetical protein
MVVLAETTLFLGLQSNIMIHTFVGAVMVRRSGSAEIQILNETILFVVLVREKNSNLGYITQLHRLENDFYLYFHMVLHVYIKQCSVVVVIFDFNSMQKQRLPRSCIAGGIQLP